MKKLFDRYIKILRFSLASIGTFSFIAFVYSSITNRELLKTLFDFNYFLSIVILLYGLGVYFMPVRVFKKDRLVDHSNYIDVVREEKENKLSGAIESIIWGINNLVFVGLTEILIRYIFKY